jgi:Ca-activated chloride channel family protein
VADSENTATYSAVGTNPFVITAHDPWSTFAADVDTASYQIFRRDAQNGRLPDPASVRLEEWVNYFQYPYSAPAADSAHPFSVALSLAPSVLDRGTVMLRVALQGKAAPAAQQGRPANLVFLVDTSGSMASADKLPLVKYTLRRALDELSATDTVAIVTYAGGTGVALPPTPVAERTTIEHAIESFSASGSTAGASGIDLAYAQAELSFIEGGINHVLLCTDGDFNVGPSTVDELVELIEKKRASGITLTVLGYGYGNDAMMEAISNKGNGVYGVMTDEESIARYVDERLLSTMNFIAKDLKLQLELNPEIVYAYRLLGYENRALEDYEFRDDAIDAGEIGAGHRVTALYELVLKGGQIPAAEGAPAPLDGPRSTDQLTISGTDLALLRVRYKQVDAGELDAALELQTKIARPDIPLSASDADAAFRWADAVAALAEIMKQSPYAAPNRLAQIRQIIADPAYDGDRDRDELEVLVERIAPALAR